MASSKNVGTAQATSLSTAVSLATAYGATIPASADYCILQADTQSIRWRDDNTNPTASVGHLLAAGATLVINKANFSKFKLIETTASAKAMITFYKTG